MPRQQSGEAPRQPHHQQPELSGAAAPGPWPSPMSADLDESKKSEREIGRHYFLVLFREVRAMDGSNWKREGIGTGWSLSIFRGWGHERLFGA